MDSTTTLMPIIKWTGAKRYIVPQISQLLPSEIKTYYEPFVGGGNLVANLPIRGKRICSDILKDNIKVFQAISDGKIQDIIGHYQECWNKVQKDRNYYYEIRERYNNEGDYRDFFCLVRMQHGNTVRFNRKAEFNAAVGHNPDGRTHGANPSTVLRLLYEWHERIQSVVFHTIDYETAIKDCVARDFVMLDPPYPSDNSFYGDKFDPVRFYSNLEKLNKDGVNWLLTYNDVDQDRLKSISIFHTKIRSKTSSMRLLNKNADGKQGVEEFIYANYTPEEGKDGIQSISQEFSLL